MGFELLMPKPQNFIRYKVPGVYSNHTIDIAELTDEALEEYAERVKQDLIENAKKRRK